MKPLIVSLCFLVSLAAFGQPNRVGLEKAAAEVQRPASGGGGGTFPSGSLLLDLKLNNGLTDASGNGHDAALATGSSAFTTGQDTVANHAFSLDGASAVAISDTSVANFTSSDFSISFWAKVSGSFGSDPVIISKGQFTTSGYFIQFNDAGPSAAGLIVQMNQSGAHQTITTVNNTIFAQNTWYHIVFVRSGSAGKIYVNGSDVTNSGSDAITDPDTSSFSFQVGEYSPGGSFVTGAVDEVAVWSRALTPTEVSTIYSLNAR